MMKRKTEEPGMIRYIKKGGGSFHARIGGRIQIIKPNQVFDARPEEIPEGFRDMVVPLDPSVSEEANKPARVKVPSKLEYFVVKRNNGVGYYDVVDKHGKIQNEKALRKPGAEALLESLMA